MRRIAPIFCLAFALLAAPQATPEAHAGVAQIKKVALVDLERIIAETSHGKRTSKDLEKSLNRTTAKFERKGAELQRKVQDLQAKAAVLSQDELMRRQGELLQEQQELVTLAQEAEMKLEQKQMMLAEQIYKNVQAIAKRMAIEDGVQVVLIRSQATVLYANPKLDITNRVILAYDKKHK
jgi:outer membrane protein